MHGEEQRNIRVGKISLQTHRGSYRVRFTYPKGQRHQFIVAPASDIGWIIALQVAQDLNRDIANENVDFSYAKYVGNCTQELVIRPKHSNLLQIWDFFKEANKYKSSITTQKEPWRQTDACLSKVSERALQLNQTDLLLSELLSMYSVGTLERVFANLKAACSLSCSKEYIDKNPFTGFKLPKRAKTKIECYESDEIKIILEAFKSDEFLSKYARIPHSYHYHYVKFVALTFCRPEDAIALTWSDITTKGSNTYITFSKAYSRGVLKDGKTHEVRVFKCNRELIEFIESIPFISNNQNLLFPTPKSMINSPATIDSSSSSDTSSITSEMSVSGSS